MPLPPPTRTPGARRFLCPSPVLSSLPCGHCFLLPTPLPPSLPPPGLPCRPPAQGRLKSLYSTFRKMSRKAVPLSEVYDARALRVVVDDDGGRCAHVCVLVVCVCVHVCVLVVMRGDQR